MSKIVLVTGAAGSIGSEISKQLTKCNYKKLVLVDIAESPLYDLITDLEQKEINNIEFILLNISKKESIAVIGHFAKQPRFQGAGSSLVKPTVVDNLWNELKELVSKFYSQDLQLFNYKF